MQTKRISHGAPQAGAVALASLLALLALLAVSGVVLTSSMRTQSERGAAIDFQEALLVADSGVSHAMVNLAADDDSDIGARDLPRRFGVGGYWAELDDNLDGTYTVLSRGVVQGQTVAVEAVVSPLGDAFDNAMFAGNSSGDPDYELDFGGRGGQADEVIGDVYSGGSVVVSDDADIQGTIRATGDVIGDDGTSGIRLPLPDLTGQDYANTSDFDVAALFGAATYESDDFGGSAWQLPESSPAHIFRKNPSDRSGAIDSTPKDDYFLEDPYESVGEDSPQDGSDASAITLSGVAGAPGPDGNRAIYYIDGNLWIHNKQTFSFKIRHGVPEGVQVTFVVRGNVYMSDNLFYESADDDGIAIVAMKDERVPNSGNVYFGDPEFGTLRHMDAFLYAEHNFYDTNLDGAGSAQVEVLGNMSAGNHILIERDYTPEPSSGGQNAGGPSGLGETGASNGPRHTKLRVELDQRLASGELVLPGLPTGAAEVPQWTVVSWRQVADR